MVSTAAGSSRKPLTRELPVAEKPRYTSGPRSEASRAAGVSAATPRPAMPALPSLP